MVVEVVVSVGVAVVVIVIVIVVVMTVCAVRVGLVGVGCINKTSYIRIAWNFTALGIPPVSVREL